MVKQDKTLNKVSRNGKIIGALQHGAVASKVAQQYKISERQVYRILRAYRVNGRLKRRKGSGRPEALDKRQKLRLIRTVAANPGTPLPLILRRLELPCEIRTAHKILKKARLTYKKTQMIPDLNQNHIEQRLFFASSYSSYDFTTAIFVDETVFQVGESCYCWSAVGQPLHKKAAKFAPKVHVWAAISTLGKISIAFYQPNLDQFAYQQILREHLYHQAQSLWGHKVWVLVQDNAPCHRALTTIASILEHAGDIIEWPANSPDLNPVENIWSMIKAAVYWQNPQSEEELKQLILAEWNLLDNSDVIKLAESMARRINKLKSMHGLYIGH